MSATAQTRRATGKVRAQFLSRAARFEVAVPIGETNGAVRIRDVQKLGIVTRRVKCNPEWFVQIAFRKYLSDIRLAASFVSRNTLIWLRRLSLTKMSPLGAVSRKRGSRNPLAYSSILKPGRT